MSTTWYDGETFFKGRLFDPETKRAVYTCKTCGELVWIGVSPGNYPKAGEVFCDQCGKAVDRYVEAARESSDPKCGLCGKYSHDALCPDCADSIFDVEIDRS